MKNSVADRPAQINLFWLRRICVAEAVQKVIARSKATKQSHCIIRTLDCFAEFTLSETNVLTMTETVPFFGQPLKYGEW